MYAIYIYIGHDSNRSREKENAIDGHFSDDDSNIYVHSTNSKLLPSSQRFTSSKYASIPKPIETNHFNMARGRGICHVRHSVDSTKKIQQQIFHRLQTQQHNGTTFANANMIALRNGLIRLTGKTTTEKMLIENIEFFI